MSENTHGDWFPGFVALGRGAQDGRAHGREAVLARALVARVVALRHELLPRGDRVPLPVCALQARQTCRDKATPNR